jgi:hypothetical protein
MPEDGLDPYPLPHAPFALPLVQDNVAEENQDSGDGHWALNDQVCGNKNEALDNLLLAAENAQVINQPPNEDQSSITLTVSISNGANSHNMPMPLGLVNEEVEQQPLQQDNQILDDVNEMIQNEIDQQMVNGLVLVYG